MTGYIKLRKGLKDDCNLVVPDDVAKQIKLIKWGDADHGIKPCESSKLLDLGETFSGSYGDVQNIWFETERKESVSEPPLTQEERLHIGNLLEKYRPDWMKEKPKLLTPEEIQKSEEELAEFNKNNS